MGRRKTRGQRAQYKDYLQQKDVEKTLYLIRDCKIAAMMTLREEGWGDKRLSRFCTKFDEHVDKMVAEGLLVDDIDPVIVDKMG